MDLRNKNDILTLVRQKGFTTFMKTERGFVPILIVLIIAAAAGGYFVYTSLRGASKTSDVAIPPTPVSVSTPTTKPESASSGETKDWKIYTNTNGKFSIQYPPNWNVKETRTQLANNPGNNQATFSSQEGQIVLGWDEPYGGGGCDGTKTLQLKEIVLKGCDDIANNGTEYWGQFTYHADKNSPYSIHIYAEATSAKDAPLIRQIFSTLSFTKSTSSGVLNDEDYSQGVIPTYMKSLPGDIPLYKNARLWYFTHIRSCSSDEIKNNDSACDVNSYIYHISDSNLSMDDVLNWYITNPAKPNWIFGTPVFTEARSGNIVKGNIRYIIRITNYGGYKGVQLTFEGPYKK